MRRRGDPRHWRRSACPVVRRGLHASTFLRPFAPRALPRFCATMDALTPSGRRCGPCDSQLRSVRGESPCLSRPHFQPFCPQPHRRLDHAICARSRSASARGRLPVNLARAGAPRVFVPLGSWQGLRTALAGSPVDSAESGSRCVIVLVARCYGRVVHLRQLPTPCCRGAVAFGYRRVNVPPDGDFHPAVWTPLQAHEGGTPVPPRKPLGFQIRLRRTGRSALRAKRFISPPPGNRTTSAD